MSWKPCRVCGNPVNGSSGEGIQSFCCSLSKCIKLDTGTNYDKPTIILDEKKWNSKIKYLTRGY